MIKRLFTYFLFLCVAPFLAGSAFAQTSPQTYFRTGSLNGGSGAGTTPASACERMYARASTDSNTYTFTSVSAFDATSYRCFSSSTMDATPRHRGSASLAYCTSSTPFFDDAAERCTATEVPPPSCAKPPSGGTATWKEGGSSGNWDVPGVIESGGCTGGCQVAVTELVKCFTYPPSAQVYCTYKYEFTGGECAGGPQPEGAPGSVPPADTQMPPSSPPPGSSCPKGTVQGGVDSAGTPICIGTGTAPQNSPPPPPKTEISQTENTSDGGTVRTDTVKTQNSDGSTTTQTTTTTTAPDGTKTITVVKDTSAARDGSAGADESDKDDDKYDLCKQNPMLTICRNSSVSGSCGAITCVGDAIQCATLRAAAAMQCQQQQDREQLASSPEFALGKSILAGSDPQQAAIDAALKGTEVDMSAPELDDSGFVSSRSCLAPRTLQVAGNSIAVNFDSLCDNIEPLRFAILACAWIVAYLIVSRSVVNS